MRKTSRLSFLLGRGGLFCLLLLLQSFLIAGPIGGPEEGTLFLLSDYSKDHPFPLEVPFRIDTLKQTAYMTVNLVQVRGRIRPHYHQHREEAVLLLRGRGKLRLGTRILPFSSGMLVHIPRGVIHSFTCEGKEPAVALSIMAPPFDGKDRIFVKE